MTQPCRLTFIGTATTLLELGPFRVLTDPNFLHRGQRAYLGHGLMSKRLTDPALSVSALPPLDAIVLSHMHGDHWDRVAKGGLERSVPIVSTPKAARALHRQGFDAARGLTTWDHLAFTKDGATLTVTAMPGRHATGLAKYLLPPVMGSVLDYRSDAERLRLYITGDTLFVDDLVEVPRRFPGVDVAVLHLGGTTLPGGLLVTMDAVQGADILELIAPRRAIPVHYDDYGVFKSPLSDFEAEVQRRGLADLVQVVRRGDTVDLAAER
jgi:L-ascorbate metabolism protein UlaG (beta-lactamase superfamily)